ncbi:hypothetical protein FB480_101900 [Agrobacterium vitis]|nr:hypothetical protein FB480_101900 [Agrobacterium vitis]
MMSEQKREYLPAYWQDEIIPTQQENVNSFIHKQGDQFWLGPAGDEWNGASDFHKKLLEDGCIVEFVALEQYEDITVDVASDDFETFPAALSRANGFRLVDGDEEDVFESVEQLVGSGNDRKRLEPGSYEVECWWWSEKEFPYRFIVENGNGRFEPCHGAH